jgi:hypothetical protein
MFRDGEFNSLSDLYMSGLSAWRSSQIVGLAVRQIHINLGLNIRVNMETIGLTVR